MDKLFNNRFFVLFADILCMLVAWFIYQNRMKSEALAASQIVAAQVPGLHEKVTGLKGELDNAKVDLTKSREQGGKDRAIIAGQEKQIGQYQSTLKDLTGQISDIKKHFRAGAPVTLVVLIDVTGSMEQLIAELLNSMSTLFETLPNTSKDFRVSILAFRNGVVAEFPMTQVLPAYVDHGKSQNAVLSFIKARTAERSATNYLPVFQRAFTVLKEVHPQVDPERRERLILLSDTGPSETDNNLGYTEAERTVKRRITSHVTKWAKTGDRGVVALYAESELSKQDPGATESREWFEELGNVSPQSEFYTNATYVLRAVLNAARE